MPCVSTRLSVACRQARTILHHVSTGHSVACSEEPTMRLPIRSMTRGDSVVLSPVHVRAASAPDGNRQTHCRTHNDPGWRVSTT
eukprot:2244341-Rhodomonas_salina.1